MPIHVVRKARNGKGSPPPFAVRLVEERPERAAGRRLAGRVEPPRAREEEDVRVAMLLRLGDRHTNHTEHTRITVRSVSGSKSDSVSGVVGVLSSACPIRPR